MGLGFTIGIVGVLILGHATYSTIQWLLKIEEDEFSGPPLRVVAELVAGLVPCVCAALTVPRKFLSIRTDSENSTVALPENSEFMIFNHRRGAFSGSTGFEAEALVSAGAPI